MITQSDPTADTTSTATSCLCLLSVEDQQSGHLPVVSVWSVLNGHSVVFNMWVKGGLLLCLSFLIFMTGGGVCESCFSSFRPNKAHPMMSCPPLTPLPSPALGPVRLCLCALCEPLSMLITITVHPLPQDDKYKSNFLCALGNLYNSILNLNETIKTHVEKYLKRHSWRIISAMWEVLVSFCFLFGFCYFCSFFRRSL